MHILVTNDDGPPSPQTSPYVRCLVHMLQQAGHTVSVCLPDTQRSWIGKAHMIGQTVKPIYYRPVPAATALHGDAALGTVHQRPSPDPRVEEWILVDGTPASCVQIGLHHFFQDGGNHDDESNGNGNGNDSSSTARRRGSGRGPVDLVISGPNYGRNTTAVFALSSGTLGAALEAAVCRFRAVALSFAFFTRNHDPAIIRAACRHSVRVVDYLWRQWPTDGSVDLYSVNVPLVEGVESHRTLWTNMLQNYWTLGSCFQEVEGSVGGGEDEEERIREAEMVSAEGEKESPGEGQEEEGRGTGTGGHKHKHFKWAPKFTDVYKSVEEAEPGNDGWAVKEGNTSVTPLKANFWHGATELHGKELELSAIEPVLSQIPDAKSGTDGTLYALVHYEDKYVQPILVSNLRRLYPNMKFLEPPESGYSTSTSGEVDPTPISLAGLVPCPTARVLAITQYEAIDFDYASAHEGTCVVNSYAIRKALIRKHFLSATMEAWVAKRPDSVLAQHAKRSESFEVDYAEFLDDALTECFDLRASLEKNEQVGGVDAGEETRGGSSVGSQREWWILKPSMSDRGQGIKLFSTMEELQDIFDVWDEHLPPSDDEEEEDGEASISDRENTQVTSSTAAAKDYITTSHLRHFVAQPYIHPPLLVDSRKFHIRAYVLTIGRLQVYVYNRMLALFAPEPYSPPWEDASPAAHLTNTCLHASSSALLSSRTSDDVVRQLDDLPLSDSLKGNVRDAIGAMAGELFEAAARSMPAHFRPLANAFEVFGLDFLVDDMETPWLLEVNAFPDFAQTGGELRGLVEGFWEAVLARVVPGLFGSSPDRGTAAANNKSSSSSSKDETRSDGVVERDDGMVLVRKVELSGAF